MCTREVKGKKFCHKLRGYTMCLLPAVIEMQLKKGEEYKPVCQHHYDRMKQYEDETTQQVDI